MKMKENGRLDRYAFALGSITVDVKSPTRCGKLSASLDQDVKSFPRNQLRQRNETNQFFRLNFIEQGQL